MANKILDVKIQQVRTALDQAGRGLEPADWKTLLEEIGADIDGHLDAIREESDEE